MLNYLINVDTDLPVFATGFMKSERHLAFKEYCIPWSWWWISDVQLSAKYNVQTFFIYMEGTVQNNFVICYCTTLGTKKKGKGLALIGYNLSICLLSLLLDKYNTFQSPIVFLLSLMVYVSVYCLLCFSTKSKLTDERFFKLYSLFAFSKCFPCSANTLRRILQLLGF